MEQLLIVDGHNLLFQMFFGMPARIPAPDGRDVRGVWGFVGALIRMIRQTMPSRVVVLFDGEHENDRQTILPGYKANRPDWSEVEAADNPFSQLEDIRRALDFLGIRHTEVSDYETDDCIAAYVFARAAEQITIASFDSDFFQLIGDGVRVFRYRGDRSVLCDAAYVQGRCGVPPARYADWKALVGDTADNIRGIPGVGGKTAARLIGQYGGIESILSHTGEIGRPALRNALEAGAERLRLNYRLICLRNRAALPFPPEALTYCYDGVGVTEVMRAIGLR